MVGTIGVAGEGVRVSDVLSTDDAVGNVWTFESTLWYIEINSINNARDVWADNEIPEIGGLVGGGGHL